MVTSILEIVAAIGGMVATWFISKKINQYWQAYKNKQQTSDLEDARKQTQEEAQKANADSDALKKIDGR